MKPPGSPAKRLNKNVTDFMTLTLHPAIDRVLNVERLRPGQLLDTQLQLEVPAGKGINTARVLRDLTDASINAATWLGQHEEQSWSGMLAKQQIQLSACLREVRTRMCLTILEKSPNRETHLKGAMPKPDKQEETQLLIFARGLPKSACTAICGSAPKGTRIATLNAMISILRKKGKLLIADTNGAFQKAAFRCGLDGLKGNEHEIGALLNLKVPFDPASNSHKRKLVESTAWKRKSSVFPNAILVTLGSQGAALAQDGVIYFCRVPALPKRAKASHTGCGDAATAGWMWGLSQCEAPEQLIRRAVACGSAKLFSEDPGQLDKSLVKKLLSKTHVKIWRY